MKYLMMLALCILLILSCSRVANVNNLSEQDNTFLIATWNLEHFPHSGDVTVNRMLSIIREYQFDVIAMQEISSTSSFRSFLDSLPDYEGFWASSGYPKTGYIFKTGNGNLTIIDTFQFESVIEPRDPLVAKIETRAGTDIRIIDVHLKAEESGSSDNVLRSDAIVYLKHYMDSLAENTGEKNFIVLGDWNDLLDKPADENIFLPILNDPQNYLFVTENFARNCPDIPSDCSCIGAADTTNWSYYDHIIISDGLFDKYISNSARILFTDDPTYRDDISNHRPVMVEFDIK